MTKDRARKKAIRARIAASGEPYSVAARNLDAAVPPGDAAAAAEIVACASRTLAAPSARIALHQDWHGTQAELRRSRSPRGGLHGSFGRLTKLVGKAVWERATRGLDIDLGHLAGEGFLEPATGRYMIDYGSYAEVHTDGKTFDGRSGRSLQTLRPVPARRQSSAVLWLLRLLLGATDARPEGTETVHGTLCRKFAVRVDVAQAAAASGAALRPPSGISTGQPQALALTVLIDGQHIRQVRFEDRGPEDRKPEPQNPGVSKELTLELWDFGVPVQELDWSRLPTFRTAS